MKIKIDEIYIYYDFPVIFSALDEEKNTFICLFIEEIDSRLKYICTKVSNITFMKLKNNKRDIRSIFKRSRKIYSFLLDGKSKEPMKITRTTENINRFITDKSLFIGEEKIVSVKNKFETSWGILEPLHYFIIECIFQYYYKKWNKETINLSDSDKMHMNRYYIRIIYMGLKVVPHIITQLRKHPDHLYSALTRITGVYPIKPNHAGRINKMAVDWIEWYDNVYAKVSKTHN
jgi:hypothetical protein